MFFIAHHVHVPGHATFWGPETCILLAKWGRLGWSKVCCTVRTRTCTVQQRHHRSWPRSPGPAFGSLLVIRLPWKPLLYSYCTKVYSEVYSLYLGEKKQKKKQGTTWCFFNLILSVSHTHIINVRNKIHPVILQMLSQNHATRATKDFNLNNVMYLLLSWFFIRN